MWTTGRDTKAGWRRLAPSLPFSGPHRLIAQAPTRLRLRVGGGHAPALVMQPLQYISSAVRIKRPLVLPLLDGSTFRPIGPTC
jgi:hypothetical protein